MTIKSIPQYLYNKSILRIIDRNIRDGYSSYRDLDEEDQELLVAECINILGVDAHECITEHPAFDKTIYYLGKFIGTASQEDAYDLLGFLRKNAVDHFSSKLNDIFQERYEKISIENKYKEGYLLPIHADNGERSVSL